MRGLDEHEWLREKALVEWDDAAAALEEKSSDEASALFLMRPEGWEARLFRLAWEEGERSGRAAGGANSRELDRLRASIDVEKDRVRKATSQRDEARRVLRELERAASEPAREERREAERARGEIAALEARLVDAEARHAEQTGALSAELEAMRQGLRRVRQERADLEGRLDSLRGGSAFSRDPDDLAKNLDALVAAADRAMGTASAGAAGGTTGPALAPGVAPDSAAAIDVVLAHPGPVHLVVDGYNVGILLAGMVDASEVRSRLDPVLARLRTMAVPPRTVTVVYDSNMTGGRVEGTAGVSVRFAPPGIPADDVIVELAATPGAVVISNDRAVRERSASRGALALWSDAVVAWARRR